MCVLFKTNLDVELKLLHIICLCMSSFSIYQKNKNQKETPPSNNLEVRYKPKTTRYTFHIPQKGSKKQSIDIKKELNTAFLHIAIENLEKALTICTYGMAFSSTEKLEEKCFFFLNHTECRRNNQVSRKKINARSIQRKTQSTVLLLYGVSPLLYFTLKCLLVVYTSYYALHITVYSPQCESGTKFQIKHPVWKNIYFVLIHNWFVNNNASAVNVLRVVKGLFSFLYFASPRLFSPWKSIIARHIHEMLLEEKGNKLRKEKRGQF